MDSYLLALTLLPLLAAAQEATTVRWTAPLPDVTQPAAGLPLVPDADHHLVYHATPELGTYNHGPKIARVGGRFIVYWYSHQRDEDCPGQRLLSSSSEDGATWAPVEPLFDSLSPMGGVGELGAMMNPNEPVELNGRWYAVASVKAIAGWTDHARTAVVTRGDPRKFNEPVRRNVGRLLRRLEDGRPAGPVFWLSAEPPAGHQQVPGSAAMGEEVIADCREFFRQQREANLGPLPNPVEPARLCEAVNYVRPDGWQVRLFRDDLYSLCLFASFRRTAADEWSDAVKTNLPDSPSLTCVGTLPDGRIYLVGNQLPKKWLRDPLTLALSRDGIEFDQAWAIRAGAPPQRFKGLHKGPGYQYPGATVVGDDLWVAYSVNKEDVAVTRVGLGEL